ncbi:MAG: hypothetical protein R3Y64_10920 [Peptostreptococcaceae bacterium]
MLKFKDVYKVYNNSVLTNVNIELDNSTAIIGPDNVSCDTMIKLSSGLYEVDKGEINKIPFKEQFYIPNIPNKLYSSISALIKFYAEFYRIDRDVLSLFEVFNISDNVNLKNFTFSELKLIYLAIALNTNVEVIFIENLFDNVTFDIKNKMLTILEKYKKQIIVTSNDVTNLDVFIKDFVYVDKTVTKHNFKQFSSKFYKASVSYNSIIEKEILKFNPCYYKMNKRNVIIILKIEESELFLRKTNPILVDLLDLTFEDIFLLGEYL